LGNMTDDPSEPPPLPGLIPLLLTAARLLIQEQWRNRRRLILGLTTVVTGALTLALGTLSVKYVTALIESPPAKPIPTPTVTVTVHPRPTVTVTVPAPPSSPVPRPTATVTQLVALPGSSNSPAWQGIAVAAGTGLGGVGTLGLGVAAVIAIRNRQPEKAILADAPATPGPPT
jgi:hypothetical protein